MSADLQEFRMSQERLKAERRLNSEKLREVSKSSNASGQNDNDMVNVPSDYAEANSSSAHSRDWTQPSSRSLVHSSTWTCPSSGFVHDRDATQPDTSSSEHSIDVEKVCHPADEACGGSRPGGFDPQPGRGSSCVLAECDDLPVAQVCAADLAGSREQSQPAPAADRPLALQGGPRYTAPPCGTADRQAGKDFQEPDPWFARSWWMDDAAECSICSIEFGIFTLRHHCRKCGRNVCKDCSPYRVHLKAPLAHPFKRTQAPHRVCVGCHEPQ